VRLATQTLHKMNFLTHPQLVLSLHHLPQLREKLFESQITIACVYLIVYGINFKRSDRSKRRRKTAYNPRRKNKKSFLVTNSLNSQKLFQFAFANLQKEVILVW